MRTATIAIISRLLRDEADRLEARVKRLEGYGVGKEEIHEVQIKKIVTEQALADFMEYVKNEKLG